MSVLLVCCKLALTDMDYDSPLRFWIPGLFYSYVFCSCVIGRKVYSYSTIPKDCGHAAVAGMGNIFNILSYFEI
jgi:hypothetical protein